MLVAKSLGRMTLPPSVPKPTSLRADQVEATKPFWQSADGTLHVGVWECSPGRFTADREHNNEICHILSGRVEMRHTDGRVEELVAGDTLILPKGWKGEWNVLETVRKMFVFHTPDAV